MQPSYFQTSMIPNLLTLDFSSTANISKITLGQGALSHALYARSGNLLDDHSKVHLISSTNILFNIRHSQIA